MSKHCVKNTFNASSFYGIERLYIYCYKLNIDHNEKRRLGYFFYSKPFLNNLIKFQTNEWQISMTRNNLQASESRKKNRWQKLIFETCRKAVKKRSIISFGKYSFHCLAEYKSFKIKVNALNTKALKWYQMQPFLLLNCLLIRITVSISIIAYVYGWNKHKL